MTKHVLLNNITHQNLKIRTGYSEAFGDKVDCVLTFPTEFGDVQKEYPIFFQKNAETGKFQSVAMLGLEKGENLFLTKAGWQGRYIPGVIARGPFLIGFQDQSASGGSDRAAVIHVDMDSPRVNEEQGEPVFLTHGGNSPYIEHVNSVLSGIQDGMAVSEIMFSAFSALDLIEPITLDIELNNGDQHRISGNYTISQDKLAALKGEDLAKLNAAGILQGAFLVLASLNNVNRLIELKNAQL